MMYAFFQRAAELITHGLRYYFHKCILPYGFLGGAVAIDSGVKVYNPAAISIGHRVHLQECVWLNVVQPTTKILLQIGDECDIGRNCFISAKHSISLEENVLIAPNVFISDHSHRIDQLDTPIAKSGTTTPRTVCIGAGSWIGTNCVILPGVHIGKHVVIGANSVVNTDIPDYSVAVGAPAKVVKKLKN